MSPFFSFFRITLLAVACGAFVLMLLTGCAGTPAPSMPANWVKQPSTLVRPIANQLGQPLLQVLIMYGGPLPSHTALRVVSSEGQVVFWDPAGDYGRFDEEMQDNYGPFPVPVERTRDLLLRNTPDLPTFLRFRWALDDTSVVIFEWDLPPATAATMRDVLMNGTNETHPAGEFSTWTFPPLCANATVDFLGRFGSPVVQLSEWYFWPQSLASALYAQSPSRVRVFVEDEGETVFVPPDPPSSPRVQKGHRFVEPTSFRR